MASVLFMDVVGYSSNSIETQRGVLDVLQSIVRATKEYKEAEESGGLIKLPTGDGMALVFSHDPVAPVRCAVEIQEAVKKQKGLLLRIGVHTGPVYRHSDIKNNINVVGGGINLAQRAMDFGDGGHILVTRAVAEVLQQLDDWPPCLTDLGSFEIKHGGKLQIYNLVRGEAGNSGCPKKLAPKEVVVAPPPAKSKLPMWLGIGAVVLALAGGVGWYATRPAARATAPATKSETTAPVIPAAPPLPTLTLNYHLKLSRAGDKGPALPLAKEMVFQPSDIIDIYVSSPDAGRLYALNVGPESTPEKPDINVFVPRPAGAEKMFHLVLDKQRGTERFWLVWAAEPVPALEALQKYAGKGPVTDVREAKDVMALLTEYSKIKVDVERDEDRKLSTLKVSGPVLPYLMRLEHY